MNTENDADKLKESIKEAIGNLEFVKSNMQLLAIPKHILSALDVLEKAIAPPEPPRLPDYKSGQWIAVWDDVCVGPKILRFVEFRDSGIVVTHAGSRWRHSCALEELPAVLEKWGEK